ncbi:MAG: DUF3999 domain-containing protein [Campylobacteraceae bacterium]|jgi:hypothetical protein|nr:DUF3999 domain-containing protein [Campylobacteraceae bacterium]
MRIYSLILLAFAGSLFASVPSDYAYGFGLVLQEEGSVLSKVVLPDDVYLRTISPDLDDVEVFNRNYQSVSFSLVNAEAVEYDSKEIAAVLYFVSEEATNTSEEGNAHTYTYFIKLPKYDFKQPLNSLSFEWEKADFNWEASANVYFQSDKNNQINIAHDAPIREFSDLWDENTLRQSDVSFDRGGFWRDSYKGGNDFGWKVVINSKSKIPKITSAKAHTKERKVEQYFVSFDASLKSSSKNEAVYELSKAQPLSKISIGFWQENLILPTELFYRSGEGERWIKIGEQVINSSLEIEFTREILAKEFMLKASSGSFEEAPEVTVFRKRVDLVFNSANNAPFTIAYGSLKAGNSAISAEKFLADKDIDDIPSAYVADDVKLSGEKALSEEAGTEFEIPKWLIWASLVLGVLFLGFLAYKLSKEMRE